MTPLLLTCSALAALALVPLRVMPAWYYKLKITQRKPLNCEACAAFWLGFVTSLATCEPIPLALLFGMAASALAVILWRIIA